MHVEFQLLLADMASLFLRCFPATFSFCGCPCSLKGIPITDLEQISNNRCRYKSIKLIKMLSFEEEARQGRTTEVKEGTIQRVESSHAEIHRII